jgi:RES domain
MYRVHRDIFAPDAFNASTAGSARFSPLITVLGKVIPTLYAGTTLDCALMETVFHDVPYATGPKMHSKAKHVAGRSHASLRMLVDLALIDLSTISLHKLGISRSELIDTDASHYVETRQWALALHEQYPDAQGLRWTSRQDDTALVLFGDRCHGSTFEVLDGPVSLLQSDGSACSEVLDLAIRLGVRLI